MRLGPVIAIAMLVADPASAADGRLGPTSQGSVRISISVAPRAWQTASTSGAEQLCVATGGGFEVTSASEGRPISWKQFAGDCAFGGTAVQLMDLSGGSTAILVRPE